MMTKNCVEMSYIKEFMIMVDINRGSLLKYLESITYVKEAKLVSS